MDKFKAVVLGPWEGPYHKIVQDYGGRSEDLSEQASQGNVEPNPNLGVFGYWHDNLATLNAIEADPNYWVESADLIEEPANADT